MNIYFTTSLRNGLDNRNRSLELIKVLQNLGHKVTLRTINIADQDKSQSVSGVMESSDSDVRDVYKRTVRKIREADVVIADTSHSSSSVGYEIAIAQSERKPILVLHDSTNMKLLSDLVGGNTSKFLQVVKFSGDAVPQQNIEAFLKDARDLVDTKFILIISPEIDRYLSWSSETNRLHKAQIVRDAVEQVMSKDKDYQAFLKSQV